MFQPFPKLTRFSQDWTVTEKIDGSNAQIFITEDVDETEGFFFRDPAERTSALDLGYYVCAGSRSRWLAPSKQKDHMGFAKWVYDNSEALIELLGPGRHYGEWWGQGIQRGYGLSEKRFSLFNVSRWREEEVNHIPQLHVVPTIGEIGVYYSEPGYAFSQALEELRVNGSKAAPGFMNPEGIVMFHGRSGTLFKKTFDYDEKGKWAERSQA